MSWFQWDAGHDDSQKLTINADINRPRERAATVKGTLEIPTRTIKGELKYALPLTLFNGVHIGYLDLEYAPNKKFTIDTKINIDKTNHDRRLSNGEIKLSGTDFHDLKVAYSTDYHKLPDQRSFKSQIHVEDSVHGNYIVSIANLFGPGKLSSDFEVTYDDDKKIGAGLGLFYDVGSRNGFDVGGSLKLHTPLREIAVTVREGFKRSPEYTHIIHDNHLQWAKDAEVGTTFEWTRKYEPGNGFEINGKLQILTPFENFRKHKLQAGVSFHRDVPHLGVDVDAIWGANKHLKSLIQYKRVGSQIDAHLLVDARSVNPLSFVEIVYNRVPSGEDKYSSTGSLAYRDKKYMYANSGFWTPEKKTVDATITVSNGEPKGHVKIKASLTTQGPKVNGDFTVTFSTGTKIIALADITRVGDSIKGKITVDPSALALDKVVIDIDHKMGGPKRQYGWKVNLGSDRQLDFGITVTDKKDGSGKKIDTLFKLNNDDFATSSVDLVHKTTDKTIFGHILSFSAVVKNDFLSVDTEGVLLSEKGLNPSLKICTLDKTKCAFTDILIDLHRWHKNPDAHDEHNDVHLKFGAQSAPGDSRTIGLIYGSRQKDNSFERTVKWAIHEEANKFIGYHFQSDQDSNGKTRGQFTKIGLRRKTDVLL